MIYRLVAAILVRWVRLEIKPQRKNQEPEDQSETILTEISSIKREVSKGLGE